MGTLVIHPADASTQFLTPIYEGRGWTVIDTDISRREMGLEIKSHDRVLMLGHGDSLGMYGFDRYVINKSMTYHLRQKKCVSIWCNAIDFIRANRMDGFYTGMIISEYEEAMLCCVRNFTYLQIERSNELFGNAIRDSIWKPKMDEVALSLYVDEGNPIVEFNRNNIFSKF